MSDAALRLLLWFLGQCFDRGVQVHGRRCGRRSLRPWSSSWRRGRRSPGTGSSTGTAAARPLDRGRAATVDCSVHFGSSAQALRALVSARTVDKVVAGRARRDRRAPGERLRPPLVLRAHPEVRPARAPQRSSPPGTRLRISPTTSAACGVGDDRRRAGGPCASIPLGRMPGVHAPPCCRVRSTTGEPVLEP